MNARGTLLTGLGVTVLLFAVVATTVGDERFRPREERSSTEALGLEANELPYEGYGEVDILDDGRLVIKVNGARYVNETTGDFIVLDRDVLFFQVSVKNLRIVESHGLVFLDREGVQVTEKGLRPSEVTVTRFPNVEEKDADCPRYAIDTFIGNMTLDFTQADGVLTLSIIDTRQRYREFSLEAPIRKLMSVAKRGNESVSPERAPEPSIVLEDPPQHSSCSVTCEKGTCSITCDGRSCTAFCRGSGHPVCECGQSN